MSKTSMQGILVLIQCICVTSKALQALRVEGNNSPKPLHDVTDPLNALMKRQISSAEFFATSGFTENGTETETKLNLYFPDCSRLENCVDEINKIGKFWNDTLGRDIKLDLTMSITINIWTIAFLFAPKSFMVEHKLPDFEPNYLFNIDENIKCEDFNNITSKERYNLIRNQRLDYGVGLSEDLSVCKQVFQYIPFRRWTVVYIKFGGTFGVPHSFGIFCSLMADLHSRIGKVVENPTPSFVPSQSEIWYYPTALGEEDDNQNYRLLQKYMKLWPNHGIGGVELIFKSNIQSPETGNAHTSKFTVVPYIRNINDTWWALSTVQEFTKYFKSIVLEYNQWKFWNSNDRKQIYNNIIIESSDTQIGVTLDLSKATENGNGDDSVTTIQETLETLQVLKGNQTVDPLVLKTILFKLDKDESNKYSTNIATKIGQQINSHGVTVGCKLLQEMVNQSEAAAVVKACQEIKGTVYVLKQKDIEISQPTEFVFTLGYIFKSAKEFRASILKFQPDADVYFDLEIIAIFNFEDLDLTSVFCNDKILNFNEHYEAILNWGKFNDFPVILKPAVDILYYLHYTSWLSFLRPRIGYANEEHEPNVAELHPSFVLRNYPKDLNNWTIDPCISWTTKRPEIGIDYFHNKHIGTIFDTRHIRQNKSLRIDEYDILLQFIAHRFNAGEIILSDNWQNFTDACKQITKELWNGRETNYFINYVFSESETFSIQELTQSITFSKFLSEIPNQGNCEVHGVHLDLSMDEHRQILNDTRIVQKLIAKGLELDIKVGILLNSYACMDTFKMILFKNISSPRIFTRLNYLVCKENHTLKLLHDYQGISNMLDTHLYLKRVFKEFLPNLDVYFRIEVDVVIDDGQVVMERYLQLISYLKQFGEAYDISYFVIKAFDEENDRKNGWWTNKIYTNLSDPFTYVEKATVYAGVEMWYPPRLVKPSKHFPKDEYKIPVLVKVGGVIGGIFVICVMSACFFQYLRYKKMSQVLSDDEMKEFLLGRSQSNDGFCESSTDICVAANSVKFEQEYNLQLSEFYIDQHCLLGTGNFGIVYKGTAKGNPAAIKRPSKNCSKGSLKSLLAEIKVHCYIGNHVNIVGFLGAYTQEIHKGTLLVATELCPNGSLEGLLRKKTTVYSHLDQTECVMSPNTNNAENAIELLDLYRFSLEIASGMDYLEKKQVVHGDLATRNVLLSEDYTCKIGDFGLSRKLYDTRKYVKKSQDPLPWKWMAYESLAKMEFTSKSDVWSYGVTLWEIFSLGKVPYGAMHWTLDFPDELQNGLRLGKPEFSSDQIYAKMLDCWNLEVELRPKFSELVEFFQGISNADYTILYE